MSFFRLFLIAGVVWLLSVATQDYMESIAEARPYESSIGLANGEKAYRFNVPQAGQMMRLEISGTMPMNDWKSFELEVYDTQGAYLFTYYDELWSATGRDSDGKWTERKTKATLDQRFPKAGEYFLYLSDSAKTRRSTAKTNYTIRVVPIRGDGKLLSPIIWVSGVLAFICLLVLMNRMQNDEGDNKYYWRTKPKPKPKSGKVFIAVFAASLCPLIVIAGIASHEDDDVDWNMVAYQKSRVSVDHSLRQQSLSGPAFRTGGTLGGK